MAQDKSKKTEKATKKSLKDARKKGQVAKSKEIITAAVMLMAAVYFYIGWDSILDHLVEIVRSPAQFYAMDFEQAAPEALLYMFSIGLKFIILPLLLIVMLSVVLASIGQFGVLFSFYSITPNMERVDPSNSAAQIFSLKSVGETILALAKLIVITVIVSIIILETIKNLPTKTEYCNIECYLSLLETMMGRMIMVLLPILIFLAIFDYLLQKHHFLENQKMTKEEAKLNHKASEGDPLLKGARYSMFLEVVNDDFSERMQQTRIIVTDYATIAIALSYEQGEMDLPIILSKGKGAMFTRMIKVADTDKIPILHNNELALIFDEEGTIDETIPSQSVELTAQLMKQFLTTR